MTIPAEIQKQLDNDSARMNALADQTAEVQRVLNTLNDATKDEANVQKKLDELDAAENAAMTEWAAAGAKGKAPTLDHQARQALTQQLAEATSRARAAKKAHESLTGDFHELARKRQEVAADLKAHALAALFSYAEEYGDAYRQALIDVERNRIFLHTLNLFFASKQDLNDGRTTAFTTPVAKMLEQRDLFMEPIRQQALAEAEDHWSRLFARLNRVTPPQPAKAA